MTIFKRGDFVQYQFDTGAMGLQTLYGVIIKAGKATATVKWESGRVNRFYQGWREITPARDKNEACAAMIKAGVLDQHRASA